MVGPDLGVVDVVGFVGEIAADDVIDFFLDEGTDVIEDSLFLLSHMIVMFFNKMIKSTYCTLSTYISLSIPIKSTHTIYNI